MAKYILALSCGALLLVFLLFNDLGPEPSSMNDALAETKQSPEPIKASIASQETVTETVMAASDTAAPALAEADPAETSIEAAATDTEDTVATDESAPQLPELPGEEINYELKLGQLDYYDMDGRVDTDIGGLNFKAKLSPSNEVILDIELDSEEEMILKANIDIAHFTMELDGGGAVLTEDQKRVMDYTVAHLTKKIIDEYNDEIPYHSLMTIQMLSYWSKSPPGYQHMKREVVSN